MTSRAESSAFPCEKKTSSTLNQSDGWKETRGARFLNYIMENDDVPCEYVHFMFQLSRSIHLQLVDLVNRLAVPIREVRC